MAELQHLPGEETMRRLNGIRSLPTLPAIVEKVRAAARDPKVGSQRVAAIVADDPAMTARMLKVANSSLYGGKEAIGSLQLAMSRLGMNTVCSIATSTALFGTFGTSDKGGFDKREFWRHSVSCGLAAMAIHDRCQARIGRRYPQDVLHLAGLLHDIGKIVMDQHFHEHLVAALELTRTQKKSLSEAEAEVMGVDHTRIGAWIGLRWNLPDELLQVIRWHHSPSECPEPARPLVSLIHAANHVCNAAKLGDAGDTDSPVLQADVQASLGLSGEMISVIIGQVSAQAARSEVLMALG